MFFVASKMLGLLVRPGTWLMLGLVAAAWTARPGRSRKILGALLAGVMVFGTSIPLNLAHSVWEVPGVQFADVEPAAEVGIVLGGFALHHEGFQDRLLVGCDSGRLVNAHELYRAGKIRRILISGSNSSILEDERSQAEVARRYLRRVGVPEEAILVEGRSKSTYQNARETAALLERLGLASPDRRPRVVLLTGALHMRRALACFRKFGFEPIPVATRIRGQPISFRHDYGWIIPSLVPIGGWGFLLHEVVGYLAYALTGRL